MSYLFPTQTITLDAALRDLTSGSRRARVDAAHALGDVLDPAGRARAVAALLAGLDDDEPQVRAEVCASLGALAEAAAADGAVVAGLIRRLDDGVAPVRQAACIALGTLRAGAAFPAAPVNPSLVKVFAWIPVIFLTGVAFAVAGPILGIGLLLWLSLEAWGKIGAKALSE